MASDKSVERNNSFDLGGVINFLCSASMGYIAILLLLRLLERSENLVELEEVVISTNEPFIIAALIFCSGSVAVVFQAMASMILDFRYKIPAAEIPNELKAGIIRRRVMAALCVCTLLIILVYGFFFFILPLAGHTIQPLVEDFVVAFIATLLFLFGAVHLVVSRFKIRDAFLELSVNSISFEDYKKQQSQRDMIVSDLSKDMKALNAKVGDLERNLRLIKDRMAGAGKIEEGRLIP